VASRLKAFVAASVIAISGSTASSAQAQLLWPYGNAGPFPPRTTGVYVAPYPYSWQWYPGYSTGYGWNWGYRPGGFRYYRGYRYGGGYGRAGTGHHDHHNGHGNHHGRHGGHR
jgi:hypothetical protein